MNCERCGKRLSRKTARQFDGVVMCAPCMFGQKPRDSGSGPSGRRLEQAPGEAPQSGDSEAGASPIPSPENPS